MSSLHDDDGLVVEEVPHMQLVQQADGAWRVFVDGEEVIVAEIEVSPLPRAESPMNPGTVWVDTSGRQTYTTGTTSGGMITTGGDTYTLQGSNPSTITFEGDFALSDDQIKRLKGDLESVSEDD